LKPWQHVTLGILIGLLLGGVLLLLIDARQGEPIQLVTATPKAYIEVNVAGSVAAPGVYQLKPGQRVYDAIATAGGASDSADLNRLNLAAILEDGQRVYVPGSKTSSDASSLISTDQLMNLNTASLEELMSLTGIGEVKAQAIIDYRNNLGSYSSLDQLLEVTGISQNLLDELRPILTLEP
jgi:competence protein ComEA